MPGPAQLGTVPGPVREGAVVGAWYGQSVVALARIENGLLRPVRVINR
jgi:hypothetical protein